MLSCIPKILSPCNWLLFILCLFTCPCTIPEQCIYRCETNNHNDIDDIDIEVAKHLGKCSFTACGLGNAAFLDCWSMSRERYFELTGRNNELEN